MKKILLLVTIGLLQGLFASCVNWYETQSSTNPPQPYCWNFEYTEFWTGIYQNGIYYTNNEDVSNKSATSYDYYGLDFYNDGRVGFFVYVSEWGYGSATQPKVKMNYITADLIGKSPFYTSSNLMLGYVYLFYVTQNTQNIYGGLELYNYTTFKDGLHIQ